MSSGFGSQPRRRRAHSAEALNSSRLNSSRAGYLSRVIALYRATEALEIDRRNVNEVSEKLFEIDKAFSRFEIAHYAYIATLSADLEALENEACYFKEYFQDKVEFELKIKRWIHSANQPLGIHKQVLPEEHRIREQIATEEPEIREQILPEDSVSNAGTQRSRSGSYLSIKQVKAKQALAHLKLQQLKQKQELLHREEELKLKRQILEAQYEIQEADLQVELLHEPGAIFSYPPIVSEEHGFAEEFIAGEPVITSKPRDIKSQVQWKPEFKTETLLNPDAKEFSSVKPSEAFGKPSDYPLLGLDVLDRMALTIRQGFALPKPELTTFDGNPLDYWNFVKAFENSIERNTSSESKKLMYLLQYTSGDTKKTIKCCLVMDTSQGYQMARKLLEERFGLPFKIASEYVTERPSTKATRSFGTPNIPRPAEGL